MTLKAKFVGSRFSVFQKLLNVMDFPHFNIVYMCVFRFN